MIEGLIARERGLQRRLKQSFARKIQNAYRLYCWRRYEEQMQQSYAVEMPGQDMLSQEMAAPATPAPMDYDYAACLIQSRFRGCQCRILRHKMKLLRCEEGLGAAMTDAYQVNVSNVIDPVCAVSAPCVTRYA